MILTHGANSLRGFNYGSVKVDGEVYKTLEYNGRIWTVENLRNNISTNYDVTPYGRLYKYSDAMYAIEDKLSDGWRLPTKTDFDDLINFLGASNPLDWISKDFGGTNKNGFEMPMAGYVSQDGSYMNYGVRGYIWSITKKDSSYRYNFYCGFTGLGTDDYATDTSSSATKLSVRICKDI